MIDILLGQTASGKTSLALSLARKYRLPIVSADAYQCYRMMSIGTDKPSRKEVEGIPYYFYDEYDPDEDVSVYTFQKTMRPVLEEYLARKQDVLVVGGTFLYVKALLYPYSFPDEERKGPSPYESLSLEEQQKLLLRRSPKTAEKIDLRNPRRVLRALERLDDPNPQSVPCGKTPLYPCRFYEIQIDKEEGNRKIDERVDRMFQEGFVEEAKRLFEAYPSFPRSFLAIGYPEIRQGLKEGWSEEKMKEKIKIHTHQYAKKQRTFLRHQFPEVLPGTKEEIRSVLEDELGGKKE